MKNQDIFKAVGAVSDSLIDEAAAPRKPCRSVIALAAAAACAAVALAAWQPWASPASPIPSGAAEASPAAEPGATAGNGVFVPADPWEAVYVEPEALPAAPGVGFAADMIGFFIHNGRMYTQTGQYIDTALLAGRVAAVSGDIDEWSHAEEYVEGASSVAGEVYAVSGYDEGFRLALVSGGDAQLYDSVGDRWLRSGADLFEACLHVENAVAAYYVTDADWELEAAGNRRYIELESLEPFIATLLASPMQDWGPGGGNGDIYGYGYAEAHLYLELADGTAVPLRLFENGCVKYDGSAARVCAYMPGAIFDEVFAACG